VRLHFVVVSSEVLMGISCPYCQHGMIAKGVKPGQYKPKCTRCGLVFVLTVADDLSMSSAQLPVENLAPTKRVRVVKQPLPPPKQRAADPDATGDYTEGGDPNATTDFDPKPGDDLDATGDYTDRGGR
jgi:hypothetical protein